jgi:hypothetical protein
LGNPAQSSNDSGTASSQDGAGGGSGNVVNGTVVGRRFGAVAKAFWIGMPSPSSLPTQVFLLGSSLDCTAISTPLWDKTLGTGALLELGAAGMTPNTYQIPITADGSYLPDASGAYNPTAESGTVSITAVNASKNIVGSYEVHFGSDVLTGTFDAVYCATGVEP